MAAPDRRVRRTRRALAEALIALASRRPYETITIRDIAEQADIGYATFFRHYASKDELMLDVFQEIVRDLESMAGQRGGQYFQAEGQLIFAHVHAHQALYRSILDSLVFTRKLKAILTEHIRGQLSQHRPPGPADDTLAEIAVNHMVTSLVGLIDWWLAHGLRPEVDEMARIYDRLIIGATWQALLEARPPARASV